MGKLIDLTGQKFGHLTVIKRGEDSPSKQPRWWCRCDCGNLELVLIAGASLRNGHTKSCGCIHDNFLYNRKRRKFNTYIDKNEYYQVFLDNSEKYFLIDKEDYDKIYQYYWFFNDQGYVVSHYGDNNKLVRLHRIIMNVYDESIDVDHIHGKETRNDNRKSNLRLCEQQQNSMNHAINKRNTSGATGVSFDKQTNKWVVHITFKMKTIKIGRYDNFEDAVKARKEAEEKYFGEWSYDNSQKM